MKKAQALINLLRENSRRSVSELSKKLGVSRTTVQSNMTQLEQQGVIQAYTIKLNPHYQRQQVSAYIMISVQPKKTTAVINHIKKHPKLDMLCTISGQYDLMAQVTEETTEALDTCIDHIAGLDGVEKTLSHVVLSRKVDR